ncbi:MAG: MaoC family dehydratase [Bordetella sp.]|uniref:MaoC family dehydratase n=1 Tax=Bordetella sp. TaxID=28081 RepID=UPI003F7BEC53
MTISSSSPAPAIRQFDSAQSLLDFQGQPAIVSSAFTIDQATIDRFAQVTHDNQWIHVDPGRAAAESAYRSTIAHGFLVLSLLTQWQTSCIAYPGAAQVLNYGFDKVRFTAPVLSGSRVSASFALTHAEQIRPGDVRCAWSVTVAAEGATRPSMLAEWLIMVRYSDERPG